MSTEKINGKEFALALDNCEKIQDVQNLLAKTMDDKTLLDRTNNLSDNDLVVSLKASRADFYARKGGLTRHQECVEMAAAKWRDLKIKKDKEKGVPEAEIKDKKYISDFKKEVDTAIQIRKYQRENALQTVK